MIRHHLSIFSSKLNIIKGILGLILGLVLFVIGCKGLNYLYVEEEAWSRILFHNFYNQESIDNIFIGSSHVFADINPYVIEQKGGGNTFNLSTSAQRIIESYYNLLEADRKYDIKRAYVEVFFLNSTGECADYKNLKNSLWLNTDFYETSSVKYSAMSHNQIKNMPEAMLPFIRFREHLFDLEWINTRISEKESDEYKEYKKHEDYADGNGYYDYLDKGVLVSTRIYNPYVEIYQPELSNSSRTKAEMSLNDDVEKYTRKIIEYCKKHNIELVFFCSPVYPTMIDCFDYDIYYSEFKQLCDENDINFYDFNLCKSDVLLTNNSNCYVDIDHLNAVGQNIFTDFAWNVFTSENLNISDYFYSSLADRRHNEEGKVYGLYVSQEYSDENGLRKVCISADGIEKMNFRITVNSKTFFEDGTETDSETSVYEMGEADSFLVYPGTYGTCIIESADRQTGQILGVDEFQFNIR